jgi:hypothetical protein
MVWFISALVMTLVLVFDHAGANNDDAGQSSNNTGGWC